MLRRVLLASCVSVALVAATASSAVDAAVLHKRPATFTARSSEKFTLEGGDGHVDDEYEFDLDVTSKQKLKRMHRQLDDGDDDNIEMVAGVDGDAHPARRIDDLTTKVRPSGMNYGRGARYVTTTEVEKGEVLFTVPFTEIMSLETARQGRIKALIDANPELPASIVLAVHLLEEKFRGEASRYSSYIESLPSVYGINSTMFFTPDEFKLMEGSHLLRLTDGRAQGVASFFDALVGPVTSLAVDPPLFTKDEFTKENFEWALGTVWARAYAITGNENEAVISPILDTIGLCIEDDCPPNRMEWDHNLQRLVVYATQDYARGEEVTVALDSQKPSSLLMMNHGFARAQPNAHAETFEISVWLDPSDALIAIKTHLLESNNMSVNGTYTLRLSKTSLDATLIKSLKIKLLTASELDKYKVLLETPEQRDFNPIVSLRNEFAFTRALVMTCKNLLAQYPTTLAEDMAERDALEARLPDRRPAAVSDRTLHILRAMIIEKEILHRTMELVLKRWSDLLLAEDAASFM